MSQSEGASSPRSSRGNPSMGDIIRSVVVIALIVMAVWGIGKFFTRTPDSPVTAVDYATIVGQARPAADFALLAPSSLPEGWIANSARYEPNSWHLGVLTDTDAYIGLEQVKISVDRAVDRFADGSKRVGDAVIAGEDWTVRSGPQDRWTFVRREDGITILLNGTASRQMMEDYVSSLASS
ncbi:hypothetical protein C6I20_11650 [Aeromicrobium sp. A1-2]|uniref:DUF4245 domain-containing protein n=1 Tax=Aeromicrobium sp. A1-2 TaxID=2107713 RepID=UPI000E482CB6|nr:DUF4245 domain-containing protein [Aeromicrobium sp. A1-2]AXT85777.1 hypothetical protein C6I20_11650 [Aeromicrobium sp. A1-2]